MFIVGYPKSGNTWFCYLLAYCLNCEYDDYDDPGVHPRSPYERKYVKGGLQHKSWQHHVGRVFKTHKKYIRCEAKEPLIYLVRDGRDVIVSYFYYLKKFFPDAFLRTVNRSGWRQILRLFSQQNDFRTFMKRFTREWVSHVDYWLNRNPDVLVRYEDLKSDPLATLRTVFTALQIEVPDQIIQEAVEIFSFRKMSGRKEEEENKSSFYRKGIIGDWRNHFSPDDKDYFSKKAFIVMSRLGYTTE